MPSSLGPAEILVILVVALVVLGPSRLPHAARQLGKAMAELRRWSNGVQEEIRDALDIDPEPMPPPPPGTAPFPAAPGAGPEAPPEPSPGTTPHAGAPGPAAGGGPPPAEPPPS